MGVILLSATALGVGVLAGSGTASATVASASGFEDADANLAPATATDWNSFAPVGWTGTAPYQTGASTNGVTGWQFTGITDATVSSTDTGFAGGVKQDLNCPSVIGTKSPNKADLQSIYLASTVKGGSTYLMLAWERIKQNSTSADAHIAFEFNQNQASDSAGANYSPCGAGHGGLANRSAGDMLVVYDFTGGGNPTISLSTWVTSGACQVSSDSSANGCWGPQQNLTTTGFAEGAVDQTPNAFPVSDSLATGSWLKSSGALSVGQSQFGEAGIDLTGAGIFTTGTCHSFGTAWGVSRSSGSSSTAQMEDLVGPGTFDLSNCATVNVTKVGSDGGAQTGAEFTLYSGSDTSGTNEGTCTVAADGTCSPSFADLQPGTYTIDETALPTSGNYSKDPNLPYTITPALTAGQVLNLEFTDPALPGSISISKTDDAGVALQGAQFTAFSGTETVANIAGSGTCTTDASGSCTITGLDAGTYIVDEVYNNSGTLASGVPSGYSADPSLPDSSVTVTANTATTLDLSNPRLFKVITIVCQQSGGTLYPSSISVDSGTATTSLSSADLPAGVTEAQICGITDGSATGLHAAPDTSNPHSVSVDIPNKQ